jgi:hypothetical protein
MKSPHRLTASIQFPTSRFLKSQTLRKTARTIYSFASVCLGTSLLVAGLCGTAIASELVNFSFSNGNGNVSGTVTGTITLPEACYTGCTQAATDITLASFPDALDSTFGSAPIDISASLSSHIENMFTTDSSGNVIAADVYFTAASVGYFLLDSPGCGFCDELRGGTNHVTDPGGFRAITFSAATPAPEPSTWATIALGLIGLAWLRYPISRQR